MKKLWNPWLLVALVAGELPPVTLDISECGNRRRNNARLGFALQQCFRHSVAVVNMLAIGMGH